MSFTLDEEETPATFVVLCFTDVTDQPAKRSEVGVYRIPSEVAFYREYWTTILDEMQGLGKAYGGFEVAVIEEGQCWCEVYLPYDDEKNIRISLVTMEPIRD